MIMMLNYHNPCNPCINCGGEAEVILTLCNVTINESRIVKGVRCLKCGRTVVRETEEASINAWNKINKRNDER